MPRRVASPVPLTTPSPAGPQDPETPYVLSYFAQRRAAGYIGLALPLVVVLFDRFFFTAHCIPASISASYYTGTRNFFIGSLCAVGIFLITSIGYKEDMLWSIFAGAMAFLVAFCPTYPDPVCRLPGATAPFAKSHDIHMIAAVALFLSLAVFCLFLFTRSSDQPHTFKPRLAGLAPQKKKRNVVYIACGCIMVAAMVFYAVSQLLAHLHLISEWHYLLLFIEWICLWAFGIAWLVKGQQLLADTHMPPADPLA
ncbi:MAG TPA: hypothetical protein VIJ65_03530 [Acidobacteriaceae bacterium]